MLSTLLMVALALGPDAPTEDDGQRFLVSAADLALGAHHTRHAATFGRAAEGYNLAVLAGIDAVQATAPDGGGYFTGVRADPPESPVGYPLPLFGAPLLEPPRATSFCSGASYAALVEAIDRLFVDGAARLDAAHLEALRMQEPDGSRREDGVQVWGHWNADGYGSVMALLDLTAMGRRVAPAAARPGDFMNIQWKNGRGHSVVFLGWLEADRGARRLLFWSSQRGTDGFGDQLVAVDRIRDVTVVRLTRPEHVFTFPPPARVRRPIRGDDPRW